MAPQYQAQYTSSVTNSLVAPSQPQVQQNPFTYNPYAVGNINTLGPVPPFPINSIQPRPLGLPRIGHQEVVRCDEGLYAREIRQAYAEDIHSQSPPLKIEQQWDCTTSSRTSLPENGPNISSPSSAGSTDVKFETHVDVLMEVIQAKASSQNKEVSTDDDGPVSESKLMRTVSQDESSLMSPIDEKKRYICEIAGCDKRFSQKTHLEIHERKHTGDKPYLCKWPGCGRRFSQHGNLKTHHRRHTGEKPFVCDICNKRFAQRGNVRAHKITHEQAKPYTCLIDNCNKRFTQLGNLKSHHNRFHQPALHRYFSKFKEEREMSDEDKKMWSYFSKLYKNSNKGIKGRGKDRKVGQTTALANQMRRLDVTLNGEGHLMHGEPMMHAGMMGNHGLKMEPQYEMFDMDNESQSSGNSSDVTMYEEAHSDTYDDVRGDQAFGDRFY
ncbi:hypothetical protein B0O99DRAFT_681640 [Bisporella sp. PMI_857]|nr:hypothetical protein B0O99DRAFT_681640 [Bisporella sp. PMI_857]